MVNIEVEYKFLVEDTEGFCQKISKVAELEHERQYQLNTMFDNHGGLMQKTNGRIRVRTLGRTGYKVLTYKKPIEPKDGAKQEIEHEIDFSDKNEQIEQILETMEFLPSTSYERYRTEWKASDVSIVLDEYPFASFVEIEGDLDEILEIATRLDFNPKDALTSPADTLFIEWRAEHSLPPKAHMRFDDYDK